MENTVQWLAGFFDGEGCLYIKESFRPSVQAKSRRSVLRGMLIIVNTHLPTLESIQRDWGGTLTTKRLEYYKGRKARQSYELLWNQQNKIAEILMAIQPYVRAKKDQVDCYLEEFVPTMRTPKGAYHLTDAEYATRKGVKDRLQVLKRVEYPAA